MSKRIDAARRLTDAQAAQAPEQSVGYLIAATQRLLFRALQTQVAREDVPAGAWIFLRTLWERDGLTQREIARRVGIQEAATGAALDKLERSGLIERTRNGSDRRKINVCLTERGRKLREELQPKADALTQRMLQGFEHFEVAQMCSYLVRLRKNLQELLLSPGVKDIETENDMDA